MMKRLVIASVAMLSLAATLSAQSHDHSQHAQQYAGLESREIKALSAEEIEQLRSGAGMGFAQAAELNHYPGPKHVLELADELGLTGEQRDAAKKEFDTMKAAAVGLGERIVSAEKHLDAAFARGTIDEASLARMTGHIAQIRGELRAVHLKAHLAMRGVLTEEQVATYDRLRGY